VNNIKWGLTSAIFALIVTILLGIVSGVGAFHIVIRAIIFTVVFFGIGFGIRFVVDSFFPELFTVNEETNLSDAESNGQSSIAMDSMGEYAVPELFNKQGNQELGNIKDLLLGAIRTHPLDESYIPEQEHSEYPNFDFSISDSKGIDRNIEAGYNDSGVVESSPFGESKAEKPAAGPAASSSEKSAAEKPAVLQTSFTPSFGDGDSGLGGLPDLDMMAMAFSSGYTDAPAAAQTAHSTFVPQAAGGFAEELEPDRGQYKGNKPQTLKGDFDPKSLAEGIRTVLSKD
jgi:hypothetical protein